MLKTRVIPCLLLRNEALIKTIKFNKYNYVGDPVNAVRIYNEREVDEIIVLDIHASAEGRGPNYDVISLLVDECFIPLAYGGGVKTIEQMRKIFEMGIEKIVVNSALFDKPDFIKEAVDKFGSQSVVASIDYKRGLFGKYQVYTDSGKRKMPYTPLECAKMVEALGVGEIMLNSIDRDGVMEGYDVEMINKVANAVKVPLIAAGGAGSISDLEEAVEAGASAVAAGSLFVFQSKARGVLINYPTEKLDKIFTMGGEE